LKLHKITRIEKILVVLNIGVLIVLLLVYRWKLGTITNNGQPGAIQIVNSSESAQDSSIPSDTSGPREKIEDLPLSLGEDNFSNIERNAAEFGDSQFANRDYELAIAAYLEAIAKDPGDQQIKRKLGYAFYGLGIQKVNQQEYQPAYEALSSAISYVQSDWRFYRDLGEILIILKRYDEAEIIFTEGIKISDDIGILYYGIGKAKFFKKQYLEAISYLEKSIELNPQGLDTLNLLGHVNFELGNTAKAREYILRALMIQPENPILKKFLQHIEREYKVEKDFSSKEGQYFTIKYDGEKREEIGFRVERILYEARAEIGSKLGYFPDQVITVILYSQKDFFAVTKAQDWTAGIYDGKIRLPIGGLTNSNPYLRSCLFHEYTHAVLDYLCKGHCPGWLNEGIAQYFDGRRIGDWRGGLLAKDFEGSVIKFYLIEGSFTGAADQGLAEFLYAQSLLAVEYLYYRYSNREMQLLLIDIGKGKKTEDVLKERMRIDYPALESEMKKYMADKLR
jgi:tetratricopeptide (TPR) repeat protein